MYRDVQKYWIRGKKDDVEIIKLITHDAILYSSKSTIKSNCYISTLFIQKNNKKMVKKQKEEKNSTLETMKLLIISSRVIKMKYDFYW
ncbi:MAG: hypothetical protein L6V78_03605 [Clostridium sp.]|nr:MAG: hypothetical protein L6V78_03605 [Clostridium sp.]